MLRYTWNYHEHNLSGKDVHRTEEGEATIVDGVLLGKNGKPLYGFMSLKVVSATDKAIVFKNSGGEKTLEPGGSVELRSQYYSEAQDVGVWHTEDFALVINWM